MMALQHILLNFFPFSQFVCLFVFFFAFLFMFVSLFCLVLFSPRFTSQAAKHVTLRSPGISLTRQLKRSKVNRWQGNISITTNPLKRQSSGCLLFFKSDNS